MRIQFCGADRTVTGSCHLLEINGLRLLLDCGMYQGHREEARKINQYLPADAWHADAIILSHGHHDHCGKLPVATRAGFKGPIYVTPASAEVYTLDDLRQHKTEAAIKAAGKMRAEGKSYVMKDGDIVHFLFNV